jgi:hypothetical protein
MNANLTQFAELVDNASLPFYTRITELLERDEITVKCDTRAVAFYPDTKLKQQPLVLRFSITDGALSTELKLNFIDSYTNIIEEMPDHIKALFRSVRGCKRNREECRIFDPKCGMRRTYTLGGQHIYLCSYKYYFRPDTANSDDADYYAKIIVAESLAAMARTKHNTALYD